MARQKSSGRLGTRLRGKLAEAYGRRGHQKAALWYVYSPRTDRDWVIRSDLHFDHFVLTEADPSVIDVDYSPELTYPELGLQLAAIVQYGDGSVQWHRVTNSTSDQSASFLNMLSEAAEQSGAQLRCFDEQEIYCNQQWLWNWQRAIVWLAAARGTALAPFATDVAAFMQPRDSATLVEIGQLGHRDSFPLYTAAAFRLVQRGSLLSDLDEHPLSVLTTFVKRG